MTTSTGLFSRPAADAAPILLVDDEVAILDGLRRQLRKSFTVHTANSGAEALEVLAAEPITVVMSDMRMPQMDGATLLAEVRSRYPNVVRVLLTGQADTQAAITAVNEGQIYRFLTKPCPPEALVKELTSAVELNRLATAEKELLASTLRRTVEALMATLSLAQPAAFGRAVRVTKLVTELAEALNIEDPWALEVTAMLSHLGAVTLPSNVLEKLEKGRPLSDEEKEMAARVPDISHSLVAAVPRLEGVAEAIRCQRLRYDGRGAGPDAPRGEGLPLGARILRVAVDFDAGTSQRPSVQDTIAAMTGDSGAYDPRVLEALTQAHNVTQVAGRPREIDIDELEPEMVVFDDIHTTDGLLLVSHGTVVTDALIYRLENYVSQGRAERRLRVLA